MEMLWAGWEIEGYGSGEVCTRRRGTGLGNGWTQDGELTDTFPLIPVLVHASIRVQFSGEDHLGEFAAAGWGPGFGAEDAVEISVEDAGIGGGEAEKDQSIRVCDEIRGYDCLNQVVRFWFDELTLWRLERCSTSNEPRSCW